jgi:hypothetical protein
MNSQLEIKMTDTPETDQCVKANKHLRFLQEDHYVGNSKTTYENPIVFLSRKLERERDEARSDLEFRRDLYKLQSERLEGIECERDEWKAKYIQQNKDLGCEMMDPNGTIWDHAKKMQRELTVVTKQRDNFEERLRVELGGHPDSELWGDAGLIAATMRCVDALDAVTDQRDRLAEVLLALRNNESFHIGGAAYEIVEQALQSLNQPTEP